MELQPTVPTDKGIAKVNAAQILSKAHCSSLRSTHTYPPGYAIPFVKDSGLVEVDIAVQEVIIGKSHTHVSILAFGESFKSSPLKEFCINVDKDVVQPLQMENNVIAIQWKFTRKGDPKNPIVDLITNKEFLKLARVEEPKAAGRKRKFDKVIKTCYITPQPAYAKTVLSTLLKYKDVLVMPSNALDEEGMLVRTNRPYPKEAFDILAHPGAQYVQFLSPYALRLVFASGFSREIIPELLKLEKTVAFSEGNFSLSPDAGSPWSEVFTEGAHATLGRTLLPPIAQCPHTSYIGGFTGFPTTHWLEEVLFRTILDKHLMVVDSPEETKAGGVYIQYLKSTIRPKTLQGKDTTISIYTQDSTVRKTVVDMVSLVGHFSSDSLYQVTDGLQFLTVQSSAVSLVRGKALEEEALASISTITYPSSKDSDASLPHDSADHAPDGAPSDLQDNKEDQWNEVTGSNRRSTRSNKAGNINKSLPKPSHNPTQNNQQSQSHKGNQYLTLPASDDDVELWNNPSIIAAAEGKNSRKADAGDFDTNKDTRITQYFFNKLGGARTDEQIKKIITPVVTIWARDFPNYQGNQLGTNFTGKKSIGGLISAIGSNSNIGMRPVVRMLERCVREGRTREALCDELSRYLEDQTNLVTTKQSNNTSPPQQQPQQSKKKTTPSSSSLSTTPATSHSDNNSTNKHTTSNPAITKFFNPLAAVPINLTSSQEAEENLNDADDTSDDFDNDSKHTGTGTASGDDQHSEEKKEEPHPTSPLKSAIASFASRALDFLNSPGGTPYPTPSPAAGGSSSTN
jgi:hypothetical protein